MNEEELSLLNWLSIDNGQYGECYSKTLDALMEHGLVEWKHRDTRGDHYGWIGLTDDGCEALKTGRASCPHPYKAATTCSGLSCGICGTPVRPST